MLLDPQSDRYNELFGHLDQRWASEQPPREAYVDGLVDPSVWPTGTASENILHAQSITDVHRGTQHMIKVLTTLADAVDSSKASTGVLRGLSQALTDTLTPQNIALQIARDFVKPALTNTDHAGRTVATALFATGMSALSAAGPIGMAAAAIVGFAFAIFSAAKKAKQWEETQKAERMRRAFELMPPLQQAGSQTDEWYVRTHIFPTLQHGSWTRLFAPRFNPKKEWVGAPRNGGYGFAPGDREETQDEFGIDTSNFVANDGVGFVPGMNRITSVCQVSLNPVGQDVAYWYAQGGRWPIKKAYVTDVGDFYVNASRYCSIIWAWATEQDASPNLYKINVGTPASEDDYCLHNQWRRYYEGALEYLLENSRQWAEWHERGLTPGGRVKDPSKPEFLFGSAIGCVAGSWACYRHSDSTTNNLRLFRTGLAYPPDQIKIGMGLPSCVIEPSAGLLRANVDQHGNPVSDNRICLTTLYEGSVKAALIKVRQRQVFFLRRSLVCAYVRASWDAFKDDWLASELRRLRDKLLTHPDRFKIDLRDVPDGEKHRDKLWKDELRKAGVKQSIALTGATGIKGASPSVGSVEPGEDEPTPTVPQFGRLPFASLGDELTTPRPWYRNARIVVPVALGATLAAGGLAYWRRRRSNV